MDEFYTQLLNCACEGDGRRTSTNQRIRSPALATIEAYTYVVRPGWLIAVIGQQGPATTVLVRVIIRLRNDALHSMHASNAESFRSHKSADYFFSCCCPCTTSAPPTVDAATCASAAALLLAALLYASAALMHIYVIASAACPHAATPYCQC